MTDSRSPTVSLVISSDLSTFSCFKAECSLGDAFFSTSLCSAFKGRLRLHPVSAPTPATPPTNSLGVFGPSGSAASSFLQENSSQNATLLSLLLLSSQEDVRQHAQLVLIELRIVQKRRHGSFCWICILNLILVSCLQLLQIGSTDFRQRIGTQRSH